jgi:hypothetical protein
MALRAIGNLTRCDENIMRVVGYGVIKGIVQGMQGNAEIAGVLQLSADVIGNLGSLDEDELPGGLESGYAAMQEGVVYRRVCVCVCVCLCECPGAWMWCRVVQMRAVLLFAV